VEYCFNHCSTPPVCEFGEYGCEARWWSTDHEPDCNGWCHLCGKTVQIGDIHCKIGDGGYYGMCGRRPLTALEWRLGTVAGNRLGLRLEVDRVNVVPCDEVYETVRGLRQ